MNLQEKYKNKIVPVLKEKFGYKNILETPRVVKAVINVGIGKHTKDKNYIKAVKRNVEIIAGQAVVLTKSKKSISGFKVREGMTVGVTVTLRNKRMYEFFERLIHIAFPRVRDFRGISPKCIDKQGNMSIGFKEHMAFPEIDQDDIENVHGLEVNIATTAKTKEEGLELLTLMGFPFKKEDKK